MLELLINGEEQPYIGHSWFNMFRFNTNSVSNGVFPIANYYLHNKTSGNDSLTLFNIDQNGIYPGRGVEYSSVQYAFKACSVQDGCAAQTQFYTGSVFGPIFSGPIPAGKTTYWTVIFKNSNNVLTSFLTNNLQW